MEGVGARPADSGLRISGVIRIAARDVLKNMDGVLQYIAACCSDVGPLHQPAAGPPPRAGEEFL